MTRRVTWSVHRPKFSKKILAKAVRLALAGKKLREVKKETGLDPSYVSKLATFAKMPGERWRDLPKPLALHALRGRLADLHVEISRLTEIEKEIVGA